MRHGSEMYNSDVKQTAFAAIMVNLKGQHVNL